MKKMLEDRKQLHALLRQRKEERVNLRAYLSEYFPDEKHWTWRDDEDQQPILEFNAMVLATEPERRQDHLALLDRLMSRDDIALIIKNLVDLDEKVWNVKSILQSLKRNGYRHHKYFQYKPCTTKEHTTGFPVKLQAVVRDLDSPDHPYLNQMISQFEEQDNNNSGKAEQLEDFLYMKDLSFQEQCPSLVKEFREKCRIPEILTEGEWCLMRSGVSCSGLTDVGVCTLLSANVLALFLWFGSAFRHCPQQLWYGVLKRKNRRW